MTSPPLPTGRSTVALLAAAQAMSMTGVSVVTLTTALAGMYLAANPRLATLALALQFIATMASTFPAAMFMRRFGRKPGFILGQLIGLCGAALSSLALLRGSFPLFLAAAPLLGMHNACWGYYRFAAAEAAAPAWRSRAVSLVMAGGVVAAFAGPELAKATRALFAPVMFAGCYAALTLINVIAIAALAFARLSPPAPSQAAGPARPLAEIMRQPKFIVAALAAMVGYSVMILIMTATPLAMADCGFTFDDAAFVIQWHALAMFAPSFFTGGIIKRLGVVPVLLTGGALSLLCMAANLAGVDFANFWLALFALGLGWNFLYIGGTTLLTETYSQSEREKVQGANDTLVYAAITVATFASGLLQNSLGWSAVNLAVVVPVVVVLAAVVWLPRARRAVLPAG